MTIFSSAPRTEVPIVVIDDARLGDDNCLAELFEEIVAQVEASRTRHLLLDLQLVQAITSAGLTMLVRVKRKCDERGVALHLCEPSPIVAEVFHTTKLDQFFTIHRRVADGLGQLRQLAEK